MPSIETNRDNWNDPANWLRHGEEWSDAWGGTASMWFGSLLPRIAPFLPTGHLLEIACGHGRVTDHLLRHCERYTGVDLAPNCIAICTQRFAAEPKARFLGTDGRSLAGIADRSIDFVFSWDSLVHAEQDAMVGYMSELLRVLRPGGNAWLHHSNMAAHVSGDGTLSVPNPHWRASSVSAVRLRQWATAAGIEVAAQEIVQWGGPVDSDCFSWLRKAQAGDAVAVCRELRHPDFNAELAHFRQLAQLYRAASGPAAGSS
ncbi:MAG: class I SAM-dependent methyltransferase [Planctomycetes bacterium]|jgi:SAM-dependent methyltransferase|nr:class I SAM-dependent methyltransferase [Planctomycetota bacterium]